MSDGAEIGVSGRFWSSYEASVMQGCMKTVTGASRLLSAHSSGCIRVFFQPRRTHFVVNLTASQIRGTMGAQTVSRPQIRTLTQGWRHPMTRSPRVSRSAGVATAGCGELRFGGVGKAVAVLGVR